MNTPDQIRGAVLVGALRGASAVTLLAALAIAPLAYGATRLLPFQTLTALVAVGGAAWLLARAISGVRWAFPPACRIGASLLAVSVAAWLLFLVQPEWPAFTAAHFARITARWPNSVVARPFGLVLLWTIAGVLALFALQDLFREKLWRRTAGVVMLLTGAAVALLGLVQNATRARAIYWEESHRMPGAFFGTFFHHTSAGAYLNTVWPMGFALALTIIREGSRPPLARFALFGALVCSSLTLAAHSGHVSRLPQVIAIAGFVAFAFWAGLWRTLGQVRGLRLVVGSAAVILVLFVGTLGASRVKDIGARWNQIEWAKLGGNRDALVAPPAEQEWRRMMRDDLFVPSDHRGYPLGDRGAAYAAALGAIADRPWFGWGPAGWPVAAAAHSADPFIRTFFLTIQFTHQDYLQICVEWGLIGAAGWFLLMPGALVHGVARLGPRPSHDFIGAAAVTGLAAVLAQSLIDFPLQIPAVHYNAIALAALAWSASPAPPGGSRFPFSLS